MNFGFDLHGVIDSNPKLFSVLTNALRAAGHQVHIITGPPISTELMEWLQQNEIEYTHFFSIVAHHQKIGTSITYDSNGNAHLEPYLWDKTKGEYCLNAGIVLHFDDSDVYGYFFKTPYVRFYSKNGTRESKLKL